MYQILLAAAMFTPEKELITKLAEAATQYLKTDLKEDRGMFEYWNTVMHLKLTYGKDTFDVALTKLEKNISLFKMFKEPQSN